MTVQVSERMSIVICHQSAVCAVTGPNWTLDEAMPGFCTVRVQAVPGKRMSRP